MAEYSHVGCFYTEFFCHADITDNTEIVLCIGMCFFSVASRNLCLNQNEKNYQASRNSCLNQNEKNHQASPNLCLNQNEKNYQNTVWAGFMYQAGSKV